MAEAKPTAVPKSKAIVKIISRINVFVYRLSGGKLMNKMSGTPICLVTMTGRKSGRRITIPLMYNPNGEQVILVASLGGAPKNPVWYYNLLANPEVDVQLGKTRRKMHVRQADGQEKQALWPAIIANFPSYASYQQKTQRDIPVMICSPI